MACTWFGEIPSCCSLTVLLGPAWVLLKYVLITIFSGPVQGDLYGRGKGFVDIKFTVPFQYKPLVLKRNFKIAINKTSSTAYGSPFTKKFSHICNALMQSAGDSICLKSF